jgi:hypothetical protein
MPHATLLRPHRNMLVLFCYCGRVCLTPVHASLYDDLNSMKIGTGTAWCILLSAVFNDSGDVLCLDQEIDD